MARDPAFDQRQRPLRAVREVPSIAISAYLLVLTTALLAATNERFLHWFILPVTLAGVLIGSDAVDWFRRRYDLFDPPGLIGVFGVYFFYVAPMLHVQRDFWMAYIVPPPDWRDWLGYMACVNVAGLIAYRVARHVVARRALRQIDPSQTDGVTVRTINIRRFLLFGGGALAFTFFVQIWVYAQFGGIGGYLAAIGVGGRERIETLQGFGVIFAASDSFPIILMFAVVLYLQRRTQRPAWPLLVALLVVYFVLLLLFGGLRGSRSNTIWGLFWGVGAIHFLVRPVPRKAIGVGLIALVLFVYFYGFYKGAGTQGFQAITDAEQRQVLTEKTRRDLNVALLGDFGRADVQAFILYRLNLPDNDFELAGGRTYVGTLAYLLPRQFFPDRPPGKLKEGTDIQHGAGAYDAGGFTSFRIYGLAGESMLNFGPLAVPVAFGLYGALVAGVHNWMRRIPPGDARWLIVPFIVNSVFMILFNDSDVVLLALILNGTLPILALWICIDRVELRPESRARDSGRMQPEAIGR